MEREKKPNVIISGLNQNAKRRRIAGFHEQKYDTCRINAITMEREKKPIIIVSPRQCHNGRSRHISLSLIIDRDIFRVFHKFRYR